MDRTRLLKLIERTGAEQLALLAELDRLPPGELERVPPRGGWTVAQVITHLAVVEEGALAYLQKKIGFKKHRPVNAIAGLRLFMLNTGIQLPVKYKAPVVVADVPATSYAIARERWAAARERLCKAYGELPDELLRHDLFKHPFMGRFSPVQGLRFMRLHAIRHRGQVHRILRALG